jgi:hypothetical protein
VVAADSEGNSFKIDHNQQHALLGDWEVDRFAAEDGRRTIEVAAQRGHE